MSSINHKQPLTCVMLDFDDSPWFKLQYKALSISGSGGNQGIHLLLHFSFSYQKLCMFIHKGYNNMVRFTESIQTFKLITFDKLLPIFTSLNDINANTNNSLLS